jgi:hypothetical protein
MNQSEMFKSSQSLSKFNETIWHHLINSYTHINLFSKIETTTPWNEVTTTTMLSIFALNKSFKCNIAISKVSSWSKHKIWPLAPIYVRTHSWLQKTIIQPKKFIQHLLEWINSHDFNECHSQSFKPSFSLVKNKS